MAAQERHRLRGLCRMLLLALLSCAALGAAEPAVAHPDIVRYSSIVVNAASGRVLEADHANGLHRPASLAKLMTLYLTFEALRDHRISLNTLVPVSAHAASMEPTKLGLVPGSRLTVRQAILGIVTRSANDAASALGEMLGGSEDRFARMMTSRARALGMDHSEFANASGLPAAHEWTTAHDMAILARHLMVDFPSYYHYFSTPRFVFDGRVIENHDTMLKNYPGADGLKTGYTNAARFNLVTSAVHNGVRLIGVVLGAPSPVRRDEHMTALLNQGFHDMNVLLAARGTTRVASRFSLISEAHASSLEPRHRVIARRKPPALRHREVHHTVAARDHDTDGADWAIQVGSFRNHWAAHRAADAAHHRTEIGAVHVQKLWLHHRLFYRAQLVGLSVAEAYHACATMARHRTPCIVLRGVPREVALR